MVPMELGPEINLVSLNCMEGETKNEAKGCRTLDLAVRM
jgi:hypothetical protein